MFFLKTFVIYCIATFAVDSTDNVTESTQKLEVSKEDDKIVVKYPVYSIAGSLVSLLAIEENERHKELKEKLSKINEYVIDKEKYSELLNNETLVKHLNETNFFKALGDKDHFSLQLVNESKNIYLQLKEKMNRDDILKVLADKSENSKLKKSARRAMNIEVKPNKVDVKFDKVLDEFLGENAKDDHKYDAKESPSAYWDPAGELKSSVSGRRLFRGERTTVRDYPFMASIHILARFWCGGAIIYSDMVITSASCLQLMHNNRFYRENPRVLQVRIGSNHSKLGGEMVDALEVYFHPAYNPKNLRANLALIRLRRALAFTYHRIPKLITLASSPFVLAPTSDVLVLGWGVTKTSQQLAFEPVYLQRKNLPVYPHVFCREVYGEKFIMDSMFCAGTVTTGEGACNHDAGGPAISNGKLVGVISFGPALCGFPDAPTVFTLVGPYLDWIETIHETMPAYYTGKMRTTTKVANARQDIMLQAVEKWMKTATTPTTPKASTSSKAGLRSPVFSAKEGKAEASKPPDIRMGQTKSTDDVQSNIEYVVGKEDDPSTPAELPIGQSTDEVPYFVEDAEAAAKGSTAPPDLTIENYQDNQENAGDETTKSAPITPAVLQMGSSTYMNWL